MTKHAKAVVQNALDRLALALTEQGHKWTRVERRTYEMAVRLLA